MRCWKWALAALAIGTAPAGGVFAADHREAPIINGRPQADLNDIYVFRNPTRASRLVLVMTVNPFSVPEVAGSYVFSPDVLYRFAIDNTGDAVFENVIDITFSAASAGTQNFKARFPGGRILNGVSTAPTVLSGTPNPPVINTGLGGAEVKVFAGPRDDPFFFDAVGFNRVVAGVGGFTEDDSFGGVNISAIVIELPIALVSGGKTKLQIEGFTYIATGSASGSGDPAKNSTTVILDGRSYKQIERTGNPAVSTALIPGPLKDAFNLGLPKNDARDFGSAIVASLNGFGTSSQNIAILASVALPDTLKLDLSKSDGFPNGRRLRDDVIDTLLTLILNQPTSDGVDRSERLPVSTFPFLAPPHQVP